MLLPIYDTYAHQLAKEYIQKHHKVFDCGIGSGEKTKILMQYSNHVIGGDLNQRVKPEFNINFRKITEKKYGEENEFDITCSFDVIEHIEDDLAFLMELTRITKPGGTIVVGTPNRKRLSNCIISIIKGKLTYPRNLGYHYESGGDIIHVREYTKNDLLNLATKVSESMAKQVRAGFFGLYTPWGAIGSKKLDQKLLAPYAQHLFLILKKE